MNHTVVFGRRSEEDLQRPDRLDPVNGLLRYLDADLPPETTRLGSLLYRCCRGSFFKTWLLREGGREGSPALQGEKALDETYRIRGLKGFCC